MPDAFKYLDKLTSDQVHEKFQGYTEKDKSSRRFLRSLTFGKTLDSKVDKDCSILSDESASGITASSETTDFNSQSNEAYLNGFSVSD